MQDFQTKKNRLKKKYPLSVFRPDLTDGNTFGLSDIDYVKIRRGIKIAIVTILIALLCTVFLIIRNVQRNCLERNEGNITLCE
jgi:hypothetical protein